jgi:chromosomal replication initiation ATPase DnaA
MAQLPLDLGHRPALGWDDFLVAPSNQAAVSWLDRWPRWPGHALSLFGPAGSGKTHLAHVFQARSQAIFIGPEELGGDRMRSLLGRSRAAIVDNAERVLLLERGEGLFHLYNLLAEQGGHLLLVSREPPARWGIALADLRSRLLAAPTAELAAPDDALLASVLIKLFADRQLSVSEDVIAYLLPRLERSFAAARGVVEALDREALAAHRRVTIHLARLVLESGPESGPAT